MTTSDRGETTAPSTGDISVLLVDDQPLLLHSLALIINSEPGFAVVGTADTGCGAVEAALRWRPDVVLMDIRMPGGDGISATAALTARPELATTKVVVVSMFGLDEYVHGALRAGASGFLLKDAEPAALLDAVRRTHQGESLFAPSILTRLVETYLDRPGTRSAVVSPLTERETEVLRLVAQGLSNTEIADRLVISIKTVKTHMGNLLAKLAARDRAQLVIAAYDLGLVAPTSRS